MWGYTQAQKALRMILFVRYVLPTPQNNSSVELAKVAHNRSLMNEAEE